MHSAERRHVFSMNQSKQAVPKKPAFAAVRFQLVNTPCCSEPKHFLLLCRSCLVGGYSAVQAEALLRGVGCSTEVTGLVNETV